jgi:hypothetical protein
MQQFFLFGKFDEMVMKCDVMVVVMVICPHPPTFAQKAEEI